MAGMLCHARPAAVLTSHTFIAPEGGLSLCTAGAATGVCRWGTATVADLPRTRESSLDLTDWVWVVKRPERVEPQYVDVYIHSLNSNKCKEKKIKRVLDYPEGLGPEQVCF